MLKIYDIKEKPEFIEEISILTQKEWGSESLSEEDFRAKINAKIAKIKNNLDNPYYCKLILVDENEDETVLLGFISMFENDGDERTDLKPWYATMFVKEEFRGNGYSKILNDAILDKARKRGFSVIYLKSDLVNYYEKFGARYIDDLENGEKLYFIEL